MTPDVGRTPAPKGATRLAAALLVAILSSGPVAADESAGTLEELMELLRAAAAAPNVDPTKLRRELEVYEADHLPVLFAVLDTGIIPSDEGATILSDDVLGAIWAAFGSLPVSAVRQHVTHMATSEFRERTRATALRLIGGVGGTGDLILLGRLASPEGVTPSPAMRAPFAQAVGRVFERDPGALRWVDRLYIELHGSLRPTLLETIGHAESPDRLPVLAGLLGRAPATDGHALREIRRIALNCGGSTDEYVCGSVRSYLSKEDPVLVQVAADTLGALRDEGAILDLIGVLRRRQPQAAPTAARALSRICGHDFGTDANRWRSWYDGEKRWWRTEASSVMADLHHNDPARVAAAIQELSSRRLFREDLASALVYVLDRPEPGLRSLACASLGLLGSEGARHELSRLLEDPDPRVREAARSAYSKLSFRPISQE